MQLYCGLLLGGHSIRPTIHLLDVYINPSNLSLYINASGNANWIPGIRLLYQRVRPKLSAWFLLSPLAPNPFDAATLSLSLLKLSFVSPSLSLLHSFTAGPNSTSLFSRYTPKTLPSRLVFQKKKKNSVCGNRQRNYENHRSTSQWNDAFEKFARRDVSPLPFACLEIAMAWSDVNDAQSSRHWRRFPYSQPVRLTLFIWHTSFFLRLSNQLQSLLSYISELSIFLFLFNTFGLFYKTLEQKEDLGWNNSETNYNITTLSVALKWTYSVHFGEDPDKNELKLTIVYRTIVSANLL